MALVWRATRTRTRTRNGTLTRNGTRNGTSQSRDGIAQQSAAGKRLSVKRAPGCTDVHGHVLGHSCMEREERRGEESSARGICGNQRANCCNTHSAPVHSPTHTHSTPDLSARFWHSESVTHTTRSLGGGGGRGWSRGGRGPLPLPKLERAAIDAEARVHRRVVERERRGGTTRVGAGHGVLGTHVGPVGEDMA